MQKTLKVGSRITLQDQLQLMMQIELLNVVFMMNTMKDIVEHHFPIINRLNPAALMTDCFYSLDMYDTYDRFLTDIAIMGTMAVLLCFGSFLLLRRNKYANI